MIRYEVADRVGIATIDRQERRNALDQQHCDDLRAALASDPDVRAVVVTGAGSAFCAGADLVTRFAAEGEAPTDTFRPAFELLLDAIVEHPAPVVAAINGPAMGAGMQLAVACDVRVAARGAKLAIPGGRLGIHLSPRNIWRLAMLVGQGSARELLLSGRAYTAEEALAHRLVERVADDALDAARELAAEIAALAPLTVQGHKRSLNVVAHEMWLSAAAQAEIADLEARAFASRDLQEGLAAFEEKRAPDFHGH